MFAERLTQKGLPN